MTNKIRVSKSGSGAPTAITPDFLGQIYIDEDTGTRYEATALTEGSWVDKLSLKENVANKKTSLTDNSDTYYPTQKAVKTAVDSKEPLLTKGNLSGSGVITIDNTRQVIGGAATISHTDSATVRHVTDTEKATWNAKQNALGFTPENVANKKTTITDSDTDYLTSRAVKTAVDTKMANPMTTAGDIIYGGTNGAPTRLAKGTDGKVLTLVSGIPSWEDAGTANALPLSGGTMTGGIVLAAGSTTIAPIRMVAGTNLTTPVAGVMEFDGTNLFFTI